MTTEEMQHKMKEHAERMAEGPNFHARPLNARELIRAKIQAHSEAIQQLHALDACLPVGIPQDAAVCLVRLLMDSPRI